MLNFQVVLALSIFLITYGLIITEKLNRTVASLTGAALVIILGIIDQKQVIEAIDFNTIGLLIGMMIIVGITRRTGVFELLAAKALKVAKGDPWRIMLFLAVITAVTSALLDNVTMVLLMVPITLSITNKLELNPLPFLISQIFASNIGGTATLIGDPPNIMIGSATGLGFPDFLGNLFIPVLISFSVIMLILRIIYRKELKRPGVNVEIPDAKNAQNNRDFRFRGQNVVKQDDHEYQEYIKDHRLLKQSLIVLVLTILGFSLHQLFHLDSATVALSGATLLLLVSKEEPEDIFLSIEWPTIFFFAALFVLVGALEQAGIINWIAQKSLNATQGALGPASMLILWLSAILSAFLDNIPFVATMIPLIQKLGELGGIENLRPLWWALSLGACLGGNGSLVGASANVIVAGFAEKHGVPISFKGFLKIGFPLMLVSIVISSIYLYLVYLR